MKWTKEQEEAINKEGTNIIVSAGAGSGKTAVLTERVLRKLSSGISIRNLLILTFTNAAALEMKERIRDAIKDHPELKEELNYIDSAYITTFDAYSLALVKKYHYLLNISPSISIGDSSIFRLQEDLILDEILNKYYESNDNRFIHLMNDFFTKDDDVLRTSIEKINSKLDLRYDKDEYLNNYLDNFYNDNNIDKYINEYNDYIVSIKDKIVGLLDELSNYLDEDEYVKIYAYYEDLTYAKDYDGIIKSLKKENSPKLPKEVDDNAKLIKTSISNYYKELKNNSIYESLSSIKESIISTKDYVSIIIDIIKELGTKLDEFKHLNNTYDFIDIAKMSIKLIDLNPSIREELKCYFNEILLDEYQDTNDLQELFISKISNNNVYMVGDIKQSIYRFRNANPDIFKDKYNKYSNNDNGYKIDLLENFRSRKEVLEDINEIFNLVMSLDIGGASYKETHQMIYGQGKYINEGRTDNDNHMNIYTYPYDKELGYKKEEIEAFIIGNDIKKKIREEYLVYNFKKDIKPRPCTYNDFVIMLDRGTNFDLYKKIFSYLGIPLSIEKDLSIKDNMLIVLINNIVKLIIHIKEEKIDTEFKNAFVSIARSFLFRLSDEEILDIISLNKYESSDIYKIGLELTELIYNTSISNLIDNILIKYDIYNKLVTIGDINSNISIIDYLKDLGNTLSSLGYTPIEFTDYLDNILDDDDIDIRVNLPKENTSSVKIMTIHKSKGLEFPICYFSGLDVSFNMSDPKDRFMYDNKYGIITPYFKEGIGSTILKVLSKNLYVKEEIGEKIRLYYVALTRAKEKIIMVLPNSNDSDVLKDDLDKLNYRSLGDIVNSIKPYIEDRFINIDIEAIGVTSSYNMGKIIDYNKLKLDNTNLILDSYSIESDIITNSHFSKSSNKLITKEERNVMDFGTHMHEVFESINLDKPNMDNYNDREKEVINNFINSDIIKGFINYYSEYEFIYNKDNNHLRGIIDLLLEFEDHYKIIDYKLSNTDDIEYIKQLNGYMDYIESKTNKRVEAYLYSINKNEFKEVKRIYE